MSFLELVAAVAIGRALTPIAQLFLIVLGAIVLAGLWGVVTGAGDQP